ncbi:MAG: CAP domain-containing protein [Planctomycetota bacterium]|jgi:hypothetical protein
MRGWLIAAMILAGGVGAEEEEYGLHVRLSVGRTRYRMRRSYALPVGRSAVEKPAARKGTLERRLFFFFDVDGNGKFNDLGVDGWALNKMPYMLPLEEKTVIGASEFIWGVAEDGSSVRFRIQPLPLNEGQKKTLIQFNQWRFMNGLPAVTIDQRLSEACNKHCQYMEHNGMTHNQEPGNTGYSDDGAAAGRRACLGQDGPVQSVHMFYASFFHRLPFVHPGTRAIGVGSSRRYTAVDGLTLRDRRPWTYPIIVPAPNSFGHPTHFTPEQPNPVPPALKTPGFPITLTFDGGTITDARAQLRLKHAKGKEVPILVSSPEHPAVKKRPKNRQTICIIPRVALAPMRTWWVKVTYRLDGEEKEHVWEFNTGRRGPGPVVAAAARYR